MGLAYRDHLVEAERLAYNDQEAAKERFRTWAAHYVPQARLMNVCSGAQVNSRSPMLAAH